MGLIVKCSSKRESSSFKMQMPPPLPLLFMILMQEHGNQEILAAACAPCSMERARWRYMVSLRIFSVTCLHLTYQIYDPNAGWVDGRFGAADMTPIDNIAITNGTVTWTSGGQNYTAGYDPVTHSWYDGPSKPFAAFAAQPSPGPLPASKSWWFTDMSFLSTSINWDFGDGNTSQNRSCYHTYAHYGTYTVTQSLTGPSGNATTSQNIGTKVTLPFLLMLLGDN